MPEVFSNTERQEKLTEMKGLLSQYKNEYQKALQDVTRMTPEAVRQEQQRLRDFARQQGFPEPPNDEGFRALLATSSPGVEAIRQQILAKVNEATQNNRQTVVFDLLDQLAKEGNVDFPLMRELLVAQMDRKTNEVIADYKSPGKAQQIQDGLDFIEGRRTDRPANMPETPQEVMLAAYMNAVRWKAHDPAMEVIRQNIASGQIKTVKDFVDNTFTSYQAFLTGQGFSPDQVQKICPNAPFYTKLCDGLGFQSWLGTIDVSNPSSTINPRTAEGRALLDLQQRNADAIHDAAVLPSLSRRLEVTADHTSVVGPLLRGADRMMNYLGGLVPEPGHVIGADLGSLGRLGLGAMVGATALLNFSVLGVAGFNKFRSGVGNLLSLKFSDAAGDFTGIFKDAWQAVPGPLGTGMLALAFGASRFTSPQEAEAWVRGLLGTGASLAQQATGRDILGMGKDVVDWFTDKVGTYWREGKPGVVRFFQDTWGKGERLVGPKYAAVKAWVEGEGYKIEDLDAYFSCQGKLSTAVSTQLFTPEVAHAGGGLRLTNDQFSKFMTVYLPILNDPNVVLSEGHVPPINVDVLKTAGVLDATKTYTSTTFTPDLALAQEIKNQSPTYEKYFKAP